MLLTFSLLFNPSATHLMLRRLFPATGLARSFSSSVFLRNDKILAVKEALLNDGPKSSKPEKRKRILILSPEEFTDKKLSELVRDINKKPKKKVSKPFFRFIEDDATRTESLKSITDGTVLKASIEQFRPSELIIGKLKFSNVLKSLADSFTKSQLASYIHTTSPVIRGYSRATKTQLADVVIRKVWGMEVSLKVLKESDYYVTEAVPLSQLEMFLVLLQNGHILKHVKSSVVKMDFDPVGRKLLLTGTSEKVQTGKIILTLDLESVHREELDLASVKSLSIEKYGLFVLKDLVRNTEIYFNHLEDDRYELLALNRNQVKRTKRLLLWLLDYNLHAKELLFLPEQPLDSCALVPFKDDDCMSWKDRSAELFVLKQTASEPPSARLLQELERFSDKSLAKIDFDYEETLAHAKSVSFSRQDLDDEWDVLEQLGISKEDLVPDSSAEITDKAEFPDNMEFDKVEFPDSNVFTLSQQQRDDIYEQLVDFEYRKNLHGVPAARVEEPVFTITLGKVLFEGLSDHEVLPTAPAEPGQPFKFTTHLPLVHDHVLSVPYTGLNSRAEDPHRHSLQFKLSPSPFVDEFQNAGVNTDLAKQMKYPNVEMWVQLNGSSVPDFETMNVATVEGDNSAFVCLPQARSDLKICCQVTGQVLSPEEPEADPQNASQNVLDVLKQTTGKYTRFDSQPGLIEFVNKAKLDFSGNKDIYIPPYVDLDIDETKIRYNYINVSYRSELSFEADDTKAVQLNIVDGGSLGGRRIEVRFFDYAGGVDRASFDSLLDHTLKFVSRL